MSRIDLDALTSAMVEYNSGDVARINHLLKVTSFARMIAVGEGLSPELVETVVAASLTHDIGIKLSEEAIASAKQRVFETGTGNKLLGLLYGI